jgi:hypothetical protein
MAMTPLIGAGKSGNSNRENSPGASGMAKIMECDFHCSRSSMPKSLRTQCRTVSALCPPDMLRSSEGEQQTA